MIINNADRLRQHTWTLIAVCFVSLFLFLGETLFNTRGSSREAVVALTMLKDGNWILPINNGIDMAYKPPFLHWLIALVSLPVGHVSEYTSRIPSALALTVMIVVGFRFYARRANAEASLLAALITLTCFEVHRAGVSCRVDMVLTCMMVLALYLLYAWMEQGMHRVPWVAVLCLSGAFLTKGPVGTALPCLVALIYACVRGCGLKRSLPRLVGVGLLSCVLPLLWYVAAWRQGGADFLRLIYEENVLRLIGKMSYESHVNPWYYNLMTVAAGFLPYTLLVVASLFVLPWRKIKQPLRTLWQGLKARLRAMDNVRLFTLLSFAIIFVFYCIPKSKRSVYLLPIYPFLAYFLAEYMMWLVREHKRLMRGYGWFVAALLVLLTALFLVVRMGVIPADALGGKHPEESRAMIVALRDTHLSVAQCVAIFLPLFAVYAFVRSTVRKSNLPMLIVGMVYCVTLALDGVYQPLVLNTKSDKPVAEQIARLVPEGRIYSFRTDVNPANPIHPFTINFYLGDRVVPYEAFRPTQGFVIIGNDEVKEFSRRYPRLRIEECKNFMHRSCDDHKYLHLYQFSTP